MPGLDSCELCGRSNIEVTRHHLIPRVQHSKPRIQRAFSAEERQHRLALLCRPCHKFVHSKLSERELAEAHNTVDHLRSHPEIARFVKWLRTKPEGLHVRVRNRRKTR